MRANFQAVEAVPFTAAERTPKFLRRFVFWTIGWLTAAYTFLAYWGYSRIQHSDPESWRLLVAGHGIAPAQYRIGVYFTANFFARLTHLELRHIFAAFDFLTLGGSLLLLFSMLLRMPGFRAARRSGQWVMVFLGLLLTQFYLGWTLWFQEPETMPSFAVLAVSALLYSGWLHMSRWARGLLIVLVAAAGATIRADVVVALSAGMLLAGILKKTGKAESGERRLRVAASASALVVALVVERWITHDLFPDAPRNVALVQIIDNLRSVNGTLVLLCTLPVWVVTVWLAAKRWRQMNGWSRGLILGSAVHCAMFLTFGMSEEVRIFVPFLLTMLPLTVTLLFDWLARPGGAAEIAGNGLSGEDEAFGL